MGPGVKASAAKITVAKGASIEIGERSSLAGIEIFCAPSSRIRVGARCSFTWHARLYCHEAAGIHIGDACLVASGTLFTCSDMHSIIDIATGKRVNPAEDVVVGNRVWIASEARLLKGAEIGDGSILGGRSTLTGKIGENSLAVGTPAKVVRTGVTWKRELI